MANTAPILSATIQQPGTQFAVGQTAANNLSASIPSGGQTTGSPEDIFSQAVIQLLQKYQGASSANANQVSNLQQQQANVFAAPTPSNLIGASPDIQNQVRTAQAGVYTPAIQGAQQGGQILADQYNAQANVLQVLANMKAQQDAIQANQQSNLYGLIKDHLVNYGGFSGLSPQDEAALEQAAGIPKGGLRLMSDAVGAPTKDIKTFTDAGGNVTAIDTRTGKQLWQQKGIGKESAAATQNVYAQNPDVLQGMLDQYQATGVVPAFGLSANNPLRYQFYAAIGSAGANGQNLATTAAANKATLAGATAALRTQQNQFNATKTSLGTMDKQLDLLQTYNKKVGRTGSPVINKYLLYLKGQYAGDADTQALQNVVLTASYEFARILSGSSASIAGTTVTSAADAEKLLNANMSSGQLSTIIGLMQKEADFRLQSQQDTITGIQSDIKGLESNQTTPVFQTNQGGTIRVKEKSSGRTGTIPVSEYDPSLYIKL